MSRRSALLGDGAMLDLPADQGARWFVRMTYRDPEGEPVDLSDYGAELTVHRPGTVDPAIDLYDDDGLVLGGVAGTIEWDCAASVMRTFTMHRYPFALHLLPGHSDDASFILLRGDVVVTLDKSS